MLLNLKHEERIGKFIQYLLENGYEEIQLQFDTDAPSVNYLTAVKAERDEFFCRAFEFFSDGDIVENFSDGGCDFVDDIYPDTQASHPCYKKVVERLRELNDKVDEVEFIAKPKPSATIYLLNGAIERIY